MSERVVILGGGHGAGQCAASLRQHGWAGEIVIVGEEVAPPYQRPPLSKAYLAGDLAAERLFVKPPAFYEKEEIDLKLGVRGLSIDCNGQAIKLSDGTDLPYSKLVLATGARVRELPIPGADLEGVGYVRTIADIDALRTRFQEGAKLVIVGAGYIGLEVAAVAAKHGLNVTVLEAADRVMARVTCPTVSEFFEKLHRDHGVDIKLNAAVDSFVGDHKTIEGVRMAGGELLPCDFAVVGVGITPNTEIASAAGLEVDDGIVVDAFTRTKDENIYAIGDCTRHPSEYFGAPLRLESVHNALEQAKTAAMAICGKAVPYNQAPWFWSDQYDVKLQTVGVCAGRHDAEIIRGDAAEKKFSVFYMRGNTLLAVDSINAPADHMIARRLIAANREIDPQVLSDDTVDLKSLV